MLAMLLLASMIIEPPDSGPSAADVKAYQKLLTETGHDSADQIKLALWCESHRMVAERAKHLKKAVELDPGNVTAAGLLGLISYRGEWEAPEVVAEKLKTDEKLLATMKEYRKRRDEVLDGLGNGQTRAVQKKNAEAHVALGLWCRSVELEDEATSHFTSAVMLDPFNETAWKSLGCVKQNGRWYNKEQLAAKEMEAKERKAAEQEWEPKLRLWKKWLRDKSKRELALKNLSEVRDPRAVSSILHVFQGAGEEGLALAVQMLDKIDTVESTVALARIAITSNTSQVRMASAYALRVRNPKEYASSLANMIRTPYKYQVSPVQGPGSPGLLVIESPSMKMIRRYDAPEIVRLPRNFLGFTGYDQNGFPLIATMAEIVRVMSENPTRAALEQGLIEQRTALLISQANIKAGASQATLIADITMIETFNQSATALNERVVSVLSATLDAPAELGYDETAWRTWAGEKVGYRYDPPKQETIYVEASPHTPPQTLTPITALDPVIIFTPGVHPGCFIAGTLVRTVDGHQRIETIVPGDKVMTQDVRTGAISFENVVMFHDNGVAKTVRVKLESGDEIVPSIYHRFWIIGQGWALANDLKAGDLVRTRKDL